MDIIERDTAEARLYMRFRKVLPSAQGMAVFGDELFQLFHTGKCAVFDLSSRDSEPLAVFPLGSANDGIPSADYTNHSNQCMFSGIYAGANPLPLLYVTTGSGTGGDENGFFYRCAVENIELERDPSGRIISGKSTLLQTISYANDGIGETPFETPCWGCPAWFVDSRNGNMYMFSARFRTTAAFLQHRDANRYIITKFPLPDPFDGGSLVRLTAKDILDQFTVPFDILFTQGGMIADDRMYYTFGCGNGFGGIYPDGMRVYDLKEKRLCASYDFSGTCFADEEIESCSFHDGRLLVNTNAEPAGGIFSLGEPDWNVMK